MKMVVICYYMDKENEKQEFKIVQNNSSYVDINASLQ